MTNPRYKPFATAAIALLIAWALALVGMRIAANAKMTADKVVASVRETDLTKLDAVARAKRLQQLAEKLNALNGEERRRARADREWDRLWAQMSDEEKGDFVERTMPTGVKQMLTAFEQLSEDRRRYAVTNAIARMQEQRGEGAAGAEGDGERPPLSEELQKKMIVTGLKTFYAESSAQTKAEVAPLLEEMQRMMESGRFFRR
jgi:hypothetical protein